MKAKIQDILMFKKAAEKLLQSAWKDPRKSYEVFKLIDSLDVERAFYERERFKLAVALGEEGEKGAYTVKPENEEEYHKKLEELLDMQVEIPDVTFTMDDVLDTQCNGKNDGWYTPLDMYRIETFLNNVKELSNPKQE